MIIVCSEFIIPVVSGNCTYDTGFSNPAVSYAAGCSLYDEIRIPGSQSTKAGEENYYELNESRFTNTYECVATEIYSELTDLCTDKTQVSSSCVEYGVMIGGCM